MKRMLTRLFVVLAVYLSAGLAHAAGPKLILDHRLTGSSKDDSTITLEYSLHVTNPGGSPLTDLTLTALPDPPFILKRITVNVGDLAPKQSVYLPLRVVTPVIPDPDRFSRIQLLWAGKGLDAEGKPVEFPAVSEPGGAE